MNKQYRSFGLAAAEGTEYVVEGYAAVFNQLVLICVKDGKKYYEIILPGAFDNTNLSNVIMYYNHGGKPVAVTGNETLKLTVDEHGLKFWAYLGGTEEGRRLWEEIKGGYITKMSFCFDMSEECDYFDAENTRRISEITDVYDVSAVDWPAYDETEVHARKKSNVRAEKIKRKLQRSNKKMTLEQINARLEEIEARETAIEEMLAAENPVFTDVDGNEVSEEQINDELEALEEEKTTLEEQKAQLEGEGAAGSGDSEGEQMRNVLTRKGVQRNAAVGGTQKRTASQSFMKEKRTKLTNHELRSLLVSSGKIASPTKASDVIKDEPRTVSSIVDQVFVEDLTGTNGIELPFARDVLEADEKTEGMATEEKDADIGIANVKNTDISVVTSISRKYAKVSPVRYEEKVKELALKGLRKKLAYLIVHGSTDGNMYGIYNAVDKEGNSMCGEIVLTADIGPTTLRDIVFGHGGDEEVGGPCRLYLSKFDLAAFGAVRGKNELKAIYEIIPEGTNPNVGIIKDGGLSVPYTICSKANVYSKVAATAEGVPTMFYGSPDAYTLGLYGDYEIRVSEEHQFTKGLNTIMGDLTAGGNVNAYKGFSVVKKKNA